MNKRVGKVMKLPPPARALSTPPIIATPNRTMKWFKCKQKVYHGTRLHAIAAERRSGSGCETEGEQRFSAALKLHFWQEL